MPYTPYKRKRGSVKKEVTTVSGALRSSMGPLMRQLRKFTALKACVELLPAEIAGMAAPYDLRLSPPKGGGGAMVADVNTLYMYVSGATVEAVLELGKKKLIEAVNGRLPYTMVEDICFEQVSLQRIERQLNILAAEPD